MISDKEIIDGIQSGGASLEKIASHLLHQYKGFIPKVKAKLSDDDSMVDDAYTDAIIKLIRQIKLGHFKATSSLSTYFYSIFYNTAVDAFRKKSTHSITVALDKESFSIQEVQLMDLIEKKDEFRMLESRLHLIGENCRSILLDWGYYGYSMKEIAVRHALKNEESARTMKYKCLKKYKALWQAKRNDG